MMTESEFIRMSEELFEHIEDQIDENGWDFDCQFAGNVLTIEAADGTQIIVNRHTPNQESVSYTHLTLPTILLV